MQPTKAQASGKRGALLAFTGVVLVAVIGCALYLLFTLKFSYSTGERVGFVQKLSRRGWVCKTDEGELAMVNMAGQQATIFTFTVPDEKTAKEIDALAGHRVALSYEEHRGIPSSCFGDTQYFVVGVRKAE